jgi:hypothetical protein
MRRTMCKFGAGSPERTRIPWKCKWSLNLEPHLWYVVLHALLPLVGPWLTTGEDILGAPHAWTPCPYACTILFLRKKGILVRPIGTSQNVRIMLRLLYIIYVDFILIIHKNSIYYMCRFYFNNTQKYVFSWLCECRCRFNNQCLNLHVYIILPYFFIK